MLAQVLHFALALVVSIGAAVVGAATVAGFLLAPRWITSRGGERSEALRIGKAIGEGQRDILVDILEERAAEHAALAAQKVVAAVLSSPAVAERARAFATVVAEHVVEQKEAKK